MLPEFFLKRMEFMLKEEYAAFLDSYESGRYQALRINPQKTTVSRFLEQASFMSGADGKEPERVPWEKCGFYYGSDAQPGKHPYHEAGVYYIQEPSAMAPAAYLMEDTDENEELYVLDLCAAPGGKSTQIAAYMKGRGLLVCNEIHPARAKILSENVERMGISNALVTNETPQKLSQHFPAFFDRILVDAPCSGEGMFRKNEEACEEWSPENVQLCADRQDEILDCAAKMLTPGGKLVYSTCTFAPDENEGCMARFLERHPEFTIVKVKKAEGMAAGVPEWADIHTVSFGEETECQPDTEKTIQNVMLADTIRLWPHRLHGEGHYMAVLQKEGIYHSGIRSGMEEPGIPTKDLKTPGRGCPEFFAFAKEELKEIPAGTLLKFGDQLYLMPKGMPALKGLKVLRPGLHLGTIKKNRFEPSHALALALKPDEAVHTVDFVSGEMISCAGEDEVSERLCFKTGNEIAAYLNGQSFPMEGEKGWYLVTVDGYSIGWAKLAGGMLKNHYPKGLRK